MKECLLAAADDEVTFDYEALLGAATARWPTAAFVPASPRKASVSRGQLIVEVDDEGEILASLLASGKGIRLEGGVDALAHFIAWMVGALVLPSDGSVVLLGWARDDVPVRAGITPAELVRLQES